jgi:hypothetical protein
MRKKYIQLPKFYLSYSQLALWLADKERYKELYFDKRDELRTSNTGQAYGKIVADALEHGIDTGDLVTDAAMLMLPKYDLRDQEEQCEMKTKDGIIPLLIKPDTMDSKTKAFREYKTGKNPWTKRKAQEHIQLRYYAMGIYVKYGVVTRETFLDWIETEKAEDGTIRPTGRVESFRVQFILNDILQMMATTQRVAKEIETAWACHVPDKRLEWGEVPKKFSKKTT